MGRTRRDDGRDEGKGFYDCRRKARERSESAYIWDADGDRKTESVGIGDKVE